MPGKTLSRRIGIVDAVTGNFRLVATDGLLIPRSDRGRLARLPEAS